MDESSDHRVELLLRAATHGDVARALYIDNLWDQGKEVPDAQLQPMIALAARAGMEINEAVATIVEAVQDMVQNYAALLNLTPEQVAEQLLRGQLGFRA
jgi:hypothetical protein